MVEIARALTMKAKLIILDEPTAALSDREVGKLHQIVRDLKAQGISIIYVTHRLAEVKQICDCFTVLRDGQYAGEGQVADTSIDQIVRLMVGRNVEYMHGEHHKGEEVVALIEDFRKALRIRMANQEIVVGTLSGGNQQKVILARCMALKPKILIVDEPTRGIDIGAKAEVHQLLRELASNGTAVVVVSSELPELILLCDRIIAVKEGRITGEMPAMEATEEKLLKLMVLAPHEQHAHIDAQ